MTDAPHPKLDELIAVLEHLRAPGGCAWDREQTHESLVQYLLEETYELVDAIESGNRDELLEELGDVLYQVIFHADIAAHSGEGRFDLEDVAAHMTAKMVGRHPHVFGNATAETADDVMAVWDDLKAIEKPHRTSVLDGIPLGMPSLLLADKLIGRAQRVGLLSAGDAAVGVSVTGAATDAAAADATAANASAADATDGTDATAAEGTDATATTGAADVATEAQLGATLLALVLSARSNGLDSERALRSALRNLQAEIREVEASVAAGVET